MRKVVPFAVILVLAVSVSIAQQPKASIDAKKNPNLAAAQKALLLSYTKVIAAQKANEWDLGGHAKKARALLEQANAELEQAAKASHNKK